MREARITAGLHHPHAVTVFDVVEHNGQPCIVMQLVESTPLSELLRENGPFTPAEAAHIGAEVASALAAAHALKIVHRDVKPGNILIAGDGSALISDFGISHALGDASLTATGMVQGTPAYLAPEVARGLPTSFASDVFSLGSTLYAMVEGQPPFGTDKNPIALLHKVSRGGYAAPKHAGPLAPLLRKMLASQPKRRPTMASVADALSSLHRESVATGEVSAGSSHSGSTRPPSVGPVTPTRGPWRRMLPRRRSRTIPQHRRRSRSRRRGRGPDYGSPAPPTTPADPRSRPVPPPFPAARSACPPTRRPLVCRPERPSPSISRPGTRIRRPRQSRCGRPRPQARRRE